MDEQKQDDQLEPIYNSSVPIYNITLKTSWERWTIEMGGKRGSGRCMLAAQHDDNDIKCVKKVPRLKTQALFTKTETNNE